MATQPSHSPIRALALLVLCLVLLGNVIPSAAQTPPPSQADLQDLESFIDGVMADQINTNHIPGAVIVLVSGEDVVFSKGYGYADLETRTPVDPATTLFRPGSVSKLFVWTAVMQLMEQGQLDLDEDVNTYLDFTIPATFEEPIRMRHLMTHSAGFEDKGDGLFKLNADEVSSLEEYVKQALPVRVFAPGEVGAYSNYGTAMASYIVERISGQPFTEYAEQHIFAPLGMTQSTFRQPLAPEFAPQMASGYNYADGKYLKAGFEYVVPYPVGGLSASGLDIAKFMSAHLQNGRYGDQRILQEDTARLMHSQLLSYDPRLDGMAHGFFGSQINGQRVISHGGDTILFHTGLWLLPETNTGLFISTNGTSGALAVEGVWKAIMDRYYTPGNPPALAPSADFQDRAALYAGSYYLSRSNFTSLEKLFRLFSPISVRVDADNSLVVSIVGQVDRFVEVEPGLLVDAEDIDNRLVMKQVDGQVYLYPSGPFTFIKGGAADSAMLHGFILIVGALLFLAAIIAYLRGLFSRSPANSGLVRIARWAAVLFGLAFLALIILLSGQIGSTNPAYGVPDLFFGTPNGLILTLNILPPLIALLALSMLVITVLLWLKARRLTGRIAFYSLLALFALAIVWSLSFWNLLLPG